MSTKVLAIAAALLAGAVALAVDVGAQESGASRDTGPAAGGAPPAAATFPTVTNSPAPTGKTLSPFGGILVQAPPSVEYQIRNNYSELPGTIPVPRPPTSEGLGVPSPVEPPAAPK